METLDLFQSITGLLNYIGVNSRPDILYAANWLSRRRTKASIQTLKKAKKALCYLRGSQNYKLKIYKLPNKKDVCIRMFVDSSLGNECSRKSVYGFAIYLENNLIHYRSKKLPMVNLSSTEAEYVSLALSIQELQWILNYLTELDIMVKDILIYCDNQGAIKILNNLTSSGKTKHLDLKLQYVKEKVRKDERISVNYINTKENVADIFTKALSKGPFCKLRDKLINSRFLEKTKEGVEVNDLSGLSKSTEEVTEIPNTLQ